MKRQIKICICIFCVLQFQSAFASINSPVEIEPQQSPESSTTPIGQQLYNQGQFADAVKVWRKQAKQFSSTGDVDNEAVVLHKIATAQRALGLNDRAIIGLQRAIKLAVDNNSGQILPMLLANLAGAYLYSGDLKSAAHWLHEARVYALLGQQEVIEASVQNDMGSVHALNGDYEQALASYRAAARQADKLGRLLIAVKAETNAVLAALHIGRYDVIKQNLQAATEHLVRMSPSYQVAFASIKLGEAAAKALAQNNEGFQGVISRIGVLLNGSLKYAVSANNIWLASQSLGTLAALYQQAGQYDDALILNSQALSYAQQIDSPELLYRWEWQAGQIYGAINEIDTAIQAYRLAVKSLQPIRHQMSAQNIDTTTFMATQGGVYLELADLLLQKSDNITEPKKISDYLLEARDTVELQKEAELQDYFKDRCVTDVKQMVTQIDDSVASDTVVLYPILLPDRAELLVTYADGIKRYTVPVKFSDFTENVRSLRIKLEKLTTRQYLPYAKKLYQWLISPIEADLVSNQITTIVVVSGQSLRTIPMSVLHDGNEFLINKFALATTPGLKLTDPRPLRRGDIKVLLTGLSDSVQGFPPLQHVRGELEEIQDMYVSKLLMNRSFVTKSVYDTLQDTDYSITHIASHSVFSGNIQDSYILTYDGKMTVNQLGQLAKFGNARNRPIELLTLSACQTAAGDDRAALGLAGVAVKSGARSALATLWSINDQASAKLVTEFYRQLRNEKISKAQALKQAQTKLMEDIRYRHPGYWSPFLLIGNWL